MRVVVAVAYVEVQGRLVLAVKAAGVNSGFLFVVLAVDQPVLDGLDDDALLVVRR